MNAEFIAMVMVGVGVAGLAGLVTLILTLHGHVVAEVRELRRDLHALTERVARIEGPGPGTRHPRRSRRPRPG